MQPRRHSAKPRSGPSPAQICKAIPVASVLERLFPHLEVEKEGRRSLKVRIPEGHLHVTGDLFSLLEETKNKRFSGKGGLSAYMVFAGMDRESRDCVREAIRILLSEFHPNLVDNKVSKAELQKRLASMKLPEPKKVEEPKVTKVCLPPPSSSPEDIKEVRDYLIIRRGLHAGVVDAAINAGVIYPARYHLRFDREAKGGRVMTANEIASYARDTFPVNIIFALKDHVTDEVVAFARRGITTSEKKNIGPRSSSGFRIGKFDASSDAVVLVESPIEALSFWTLLSRTQPELTRRVCIIGTCGVSNAQEILVAAKNRGIKRVVSALNNDPAGRNYNAKTMALAREMGFLAAQLIPAAEVTLSVFKRPAFLNVAAPMVDQLIKLGYPVMEVPSENPNWAEYTFPNSHEACTLAEEIQRRRLGYQKVEGKKVPDLLEKRAELEAALNQAGVKFTLVDADENTWRMGIPRDSESDKITIPWVNKTDKWLSAMRREDDLKREFVRLIDFDFFPKDFNEVCQGACECEAARDIEPPLDLAAFLSSEPEATVATVPISASSLAA